MSDSTSVHVALMTAAEAARLLKTTPATIRRKSHAGLLPSLSLEKGPAYFALNDVLALANREWNAPSLTAERHACLLVREQKRFTQELLALIVAPLASGNCVLLAFERVQTRLTPLLTNAHAKRAHAENRLRGIETSANDLDERLRLFRSEIASASTPLVIVSEKNYRTSNAELARYEMELNHLLSEESSLSLVCVYDAQRFDGETVLDVLQSHPAAWIDGIHQVGFMGER